LRGRISPRLAATLVAIVKGHKNKIAELLPWTCAATV
jgi:hypothetical protein